MNKIKKFLVVGLLVIICFGMCGCDREEVVYLDSTQKDFIDNVEYQVIDGYFENIRVYTFTDTETGKEYLLISNADSIQLIERTGAEPENVDGFEWEDE